MRNTPRSGFSLLGAGLLTPPKPPWHGQETGHSQVVEGGFT
jgi:hypothetical protein